MLAATLSLAAEPVRIAGSDWVGDAPTKVADRLDYFNLGRGADEPLIEVLDFGSGLEAVNSLVEGRSQFALGATAPVAAALQEQTGEQADGLPDFVILASVALSNRTHRLIVRDAGSVRVPREWDKLRVGIMFGTSSHSGWSRFAAFHGLDEDNYTLVDTPVRQMARALLSDEVDAVVVWSPWERKLQEQFSGELIEFPLRMIYTVNWLLLADRLFARDNPEVVQRVLRGYLKAMDFIDAEPDRAHQLHADYHEIPPDLIIAQSEGMIWRIGLNWSVLVSMGTQLDWLASQPGFDGQKPNPQHYLYARPLQALAPERVTVPHYLLLGSLAPDAQR